MTKKGMVAFFLVFAVAGALFMGLGITISMSYKNFVKVAGFTQAEITDISVKRDSDGDKHYDVWISYEVDGKTYENKSDSYNISMKRGQSIGVYYDKNDPYIIKSEQKGFAVEYVFIAIGAVLFLIGVIVPLISILKGSTRKKLVKNGILVDAKVLEIRLNMSVRVNYRHPYIIIFECTNPVTNEFGVYTSHNLWTNPLMFVQPGETMPVYFDSENGQKYYADVESMEPIKVYDTE